MAVNDIYRISMVQSLRGEPVINTFHYLETIAGAGTDENALFTAFNAAVVPSHVALVPTAQLYLTFLIQGVRPVKPVIPFVPTIATGSAAGDWAPPQDAVIITRKSATPGKGGRGRLFVGAIPQSSLVAGQDHSVTVAPYLVLAANMLLALSNGGFTFVPVIFKRRSLSFLPIVTTPTNNIIKTRRSRAFGTRFHRRKRHTVGSI